MTKDDPSTPEPEPETRVHTDALPPYTGAVGPDEPDGSDDRRAASRPAHPTWHLVSQRHAGCHVRAPGRSRRVPLTRSMGTGPGSETTSPRMARISTEENQSHELE